MRSMTRLRSEGSNLINSYSLENLKNKEEGRV